MSPYAIRRLADRFAMLSVLAAAAHACLINPKDYPVRASSKASSGGVAGSSSSGATSSAASSGAASTSGGFGGAGIVATAGVSNQAGAGEATDVSVELHTSCAPWRTVGAL